MFCLPRFTPWVALLGGALAVDLRRISGQAPGWSFHKQVVARDGRSVRSHGSAVEPGDRRPVQDIESFFECPLTDANRDKPVGHFPAVGGTFGTWPCQIGRACRCGETACVRWRSGCAERDHGPDHRVSIVQTAAVAD